eukprot:scaffold57081_cov28-Phaeocystis_antarctica.AAC.2
MGCAWVWRGVRRTCTLVALVARSAVVRPDPRVHLRRAAWVGRAAREATLPRTGGGRSHRLVLSVGGGPREHPAAARPQALLGVLLDVVRRGACPRGRRGGVGLVALRADEALARLGALDVLRLVDIHILELGLALAREDHLDLLVAPLPEAAALALVVDLALAAEPVRRAVLERLLRRVEDALAAARRACEAVTAGDHAR